MDAFPSDPSRSEISLAMENALDSAQDYLDYSAFSRLGLIDQLSSEYGEGFELEDATWAVDQLHADWNEQAVKSAKEYLDYSSFSRQGLIDQLSSPYGEQSPLPRRPTRSTRSACDPHAEQPLIWKSVDMRSLVSTIITCIRSLLHLSVFRH